MLHEIDLSRVDLNLLVLFEAVYAESHVGRAAGRLSLSSSAVSHGLGRLRQLLSDPLFLKTPKGVVPTDRATALAPLIAGVLERVRAVISQAEPFEPANSSRRFTIGAPDGVSAVFLQPLLTAIRREAPGIDIGIRQLLPVAVETVPDRAWRMAFAELETRSLDVAVVPSRDGPLRFHKRILFEEDFVLVMRPEHSYLDAPTVDSYCGSSHLVVSHTGDPYGFVDEVLAEGGLSRRVALTVPNFMFAAAIVAQTDLLCAVPRRFAKLFGRQFGLAMTDAPLPIGSFALTAFVPKSALTDAGLIWLLDHLSRTGAQIDPS